VQETPAVWGTRTTVERVLGADCRVFVDRPRHLAELLRIASAFGESPHLVQDRRVVSFADLAEQADVVADAFRAAGAVHGDRVLLLGANSIDWVVAFWACATSGLVAVPGNSWWSDEEIAHAVRTVAPRVAVVDGQRREKLPPHVPTLTFADVRAAAEGAVRGAGEHGAGDAPAGEDLPAVILFTSGTTGFPKAATLSHRSLISGVHSVLASSGQTPGETQRRPRPRLVSLPLFHIGSISQLLLALLSGGALVFLEGRFEPAKALRLIERHAIASWAAVPTMVSRVIDELERAPQGTYDVSGLRSVAMGAANVDGTLRIRTRDAFPGLRDGIVVSYGLTESGGVVSMAVGPSVLDRPGTVGRALPTVDIKIDDKEASGAGEVLVRSPGVMIGFWGSASDPTLGDDRWLRTGDLGFVDEEGYLFLTGRLKDIIVRGGENITSLRVETRLLEHPAVAEVAVVGLPHSDLGEEVAADVVLRAEHRASETELREFAAATLAHFEVPSRWSIGHTELPRTATGKILKREVTQRWGDRAGTAAPTIGPPQSS
jgi:long-chain acyl-CoA synthetase